MKIGLLTYHDTTNYGATLQCYSLAKAVIEMGYECEIINYQCEMIIRRELPHIILNGTLRNFIGSIMRFPKRWIKHRNLQNFLQKDLHLSKRYDKSSINQSVEKYDFFLVGSDILWSLDINGYDYTYFLDFLSDDSKKLSYATSSGEAWKIEDVDKVSKFLSKFKRISVRERETVDFLAQYINKDVSVVCDPTMLLPCDFWLSFIKNKNKKENYILVYLPNKKCEADAIVFAKSHNLPVKKLHAWSKMEEFFSAIYHAAYIFTGSYHGLLFSLYFHTNFFYYNFQDKYRMEFLETKFHISPFSALEKETIEDITSLDWDKIDLEMKNFRNESLEYLRDCFQK